MLKNQQNGFIGLILLLIFMIVGGIAFAVTRVISKQGL